MLAVIGVAQANYKSGSVSTYEKFTYGKFVTRMKAPNQKGTVTSFFTYWDGPGFYPGGWNELDVEIVPSVEANPLSTNVIYGDGHNKLEDHDYAQSFDPRDDWHTYAFEWTPEYISFAVDGNEVRHMAADSVDAVELVNKAQSLRMNFWTPTFHSWGEGFNPSDMPWYALYDYVEVFTYNKHSNEFELHWRDDFNDFDSGRWHKASGGFEANSSVFYPQQVYTHDGNLVIKMEPMDDETLHHGHDQSHEHSMLHGVTQLDLSHGHQMHMPLHSHVPDDLPSLPHVTDLPSHHKSDPIKHDPSLVRHKLQLHGPETKSDSIDQKLIEEVNDKSDKGVSIADLEKEREEEPEQK